MAISESFAGISGVLTQPWSSAGPGTTREVSWLIPGHTKSKPVAELKSELRLLPALWFNNHKASLPPKRREQVLKSICSYLFQRNHRLNKRKLVRQQKSFLFLIFFMRPKEWGTLELSVIAQKAKICIWQLESKHPAKLLSLVLNKVQNYSLPDSANTHR